MKIDPTLLERPANEPWFVSSRASQRDRFERCIRLIGKVRHRYRRALDIGCGQGHFTRRLARICDEVMGIDASPVAVQRSREMSGNLSNIQFDCKRFPISDAAGGEFDLVCAQEVLYYFSKDELDDFFEEVRRLMTADGVFLMTVNVYGETKAKRSDCEERLKRTFRIVAGEIVYRELYYRIELPLIRLLEDLEYLLKWRVFDVRDHPPALNSQLLARATKLPGFFKVDRLAGKVVAFVARSILNSKVLFRSIEAFNRYCLPSRGRNQFIVVATGR